MNPEILIALLKLLEAGVPLDHGNRPDARITMLEEAVKAILTFMMEPKSGAAPKAEALAVEAKP